MPIILTLDGDIVITWRDLEDPTEPILVAHIKEDIRKGLGPPNTMLPWSKVNTLVCLVIVERGQQCGITFKDNGMMNRHFHKQHTGCFLTPDTAAITSKERADSHKILARYVVSTDWRNAHFLAEPGRSPIGSDIGQSADVCSYFASGVRISIGIMFQEQR
ncbi:hypothetical protein N7495_002418 [Penicillium taxi]|uniref:uncharacterized protein n=1 Tax=Penicillium taxi TaxID=168475 RepID=UPI0025452523|nr:uncharacterized protein N7495_002418 [Penicillium taxi]KAJ5901890.1 hypothetical protein N7495_002418 [Penicillium taxi]